MQTATLATAPLSFLSGARANETPLVIFTAVDHVWPREAVRPAPDAVGAVQWLVSRNVPMVLVSQRPAADVIALQSALGVRHPFVCDGGASLYVPAAYFPELTRIGRFRDGWNVVEFKAPHDTGPAVRLLASLYRVCCGDAVIVGLVDRWADRTLLHEVDVPVIVRAPHPDVVRLVECMPAAYLTNAPGPAGWSEAILGALPE